jgi:hypothetical protein
VSGGFHPFRIPFSLSRERDHKYNRLVITLALGITYWLMRERDDRLAGNGARPD